MGTSILSIALYWFSYTTFEYATAIVAQKFYGPLLSIVLLYLIVILWLANARSENKRKKILPFILALVFVDLSTSMFWHCRNTSWNLGNQYNEMPLTAMGAANKEKSYTNKLLTIGDVKKLEESGVSVVKLPYTAISPVAGSTWCDELYSADNPAAAPYIMLDETLKADPVFGKFFGPPRRLADKDISVEIPRRTYNRVQLSVKTPRDSLFFWRDAWSPYWKAKVNGADAPVAKAMGAFKAVALPAGESTVEFDFSPGALPYALALAYLIFYSAAGWIVFLAARDLRAAKKP